MKLCTATKIVGICNDFEECFWNKVDQKKEEKVYVKKFHLHKIEFIEDLRCAIMLIVFICS